MAKKNLKDNSMFSTISSDKLREEGKKYLEENFGHLKEKRELIQYNRIKLARGLISGVHSELCVGGNPAVALQQIDSILSFIDNQILPTFKFFLRDQKEKTDIMLKAIKTSESDRLMEKQSNINK